MLIDISVSRTHCLIEYREDGFYVKDLKSKFGTLVLIPEKYKMELDHMSFV